MAVSAPGQSSFGFTQAGGVKLKKLNSSGAPQPCVAGASVIVPPTPSTDLRFGHSMTLMKSSISATSKWLAVGAPASTVGGYVSIYDDPFALTPTERNRLQGAPNEKFGLGIAQQPDVVWQPSTGVGELLIAAPGNGGANAKIYLVNPSQLPTSGLVTVGPSTHKYLVYPNADWSFGTRFAFGDFTGDATIDLAVANWSDDPAKSGVAIYDGAAIVNHLQAGTGGLNPAASFNETTPSVGVTSLVQFSAWFGKSLASVHNPRTNADALIVGAPFAYDSMSSALISGAVVVIKKDPGTNQPVVVNGGVIMGDLPEKAFGDELRANEKGILAVGATDTIPNGAGEILSYDGAGLVSEFSPLVRQTIPGIFSRKLHRYVAPGTGAMDPYLGSTITRVKYPGENVTSFIGSAYANNTGGSQLPYIDNYNAIRVADGELGVCNLGHSTPITLTGARNPGTGNIDLSVTVGGSQSFPYLVLYLDYIAVLPDVTPPVSTSLPLWVVAAGSCGGAPNMLSLDFMTMNIFPVFPVQGLTGFQKKVMAVVIEPLAGGAMRFHASNVLDVSTSNF